MNKEPIIFITKPEKQLIEKDNLEIEIYNYDNSHLYYKGFDLGTFKEIANLRQENKQLKEKLDCDLQWALKYEKQVGNWNKLKEYLKTIYKGCPPHEKEVLMFITDKMQELEQGSDSNVKD